MRPHEHRGATNVVGVLIVAGLLATSAGAFKFVMAPRTLSRLALAGVVALTVTSGAISFGGEDVTEVVIDAAVVAGKRKPILRRAEGVATKRDAA